MTGTTKGLRVCSAALLGCVCAMMMFGATAYSEEDKWVMQSKIEGDDVLDRKWAHEREAKKGVTYNERNGRLERRAKVPLTADQSFSITLSSFDFQPMIRVLNARGKIVKQSEGIAPVKQDEKTLYSCSIDFIPEDRGTFTLVYTSVEPYVQGSYSVSGAVWVPESKMEKEKETVVAGGGDPKDLAIYTVDANESNGPKKHFWYRGWKDVSNPASKYAISVAGVDVIWLESGDSLDTLGMPGASAPKSSSWRASNIELIDGDIYYLKPDKYKQLVLIVNAEKELYTAISVYPNYKHLFPAQVQVARNKMAEIAATARKRQGS